MNGKCNLLKPVDSITGTFFMFSQYSQDLTEAYTKQDSYRSVPSKSVCLNLNVSKYNSKTLGEVFQNYYENACTRLRIEEKGWTPSYAAVLLWRTLEKFGLITKETKTEKGATMTYYPEIQHIDDINIYSYNQGEDGIGFNEVYCYVPNDARKTLYPCEEQHYGSAYKNADAYIIGWSGEPYNGLSYTTVWPTGDSSFSYEARGWVPSCVYSANTSLTQERLSGAIAQEDEKFDINAVIVLYDIVSKTADGGSQVKYCNIPMGIYFTGKPDEEGKLTNVIEKYVQHPDIYNQGTSWGLRICSRFMCVPNRVEFKSNETQTYNDIDDLTGVMSAFADSASLMNEAMVTNSQVLETLRSHLANFKNYQTNVPYIRPIGEDNYWFINGKNTGVKVNSTIINNIYNEGTDKDIPTAVDNGFIPGIFTGAEYGGMNSFYITLDNLQKFYNQLSKESGAVTISSVIDLIERYGLQYTLENVNNQGTKLRFSKKNELTDTFNDVTIPIGVDYLNDSTFVQS